MIDESKSLAVGIIVCGFTCSNDVGGRLKFWLDDIEISFRDHLWFITDSVNGEAGYISLRDLMENESWRFEDEE